MTNSWAARVLYRLRKKYPDSSKAAIAVKSCKPENQRRVTLWLIEELNLLQVKMSNGDKT